MKNIFKPQIFNILTFSLFIAIGVFSCETNDLVGLDNPATGYSFEISQDSFVVQDGTSTYDIEVQASSISSQDRTVTISLDTANTVASTNLFAFNSSITIPAGHLVGYSTVTFDFAGLDFSPLQASFDIDLSDTQLPIEGKTDFTLEFRKFCPLNDVQLEITTDDYPEETTWELYDINVSTAVPIASGGPYVNPDDNNTTKTEYFCLSAGTYGIVVYDSYGDGIVGGGYTIQSNGVTVGSGSPPNNGTGGAQPSLASSSFILN